SSSRQQPRGGEVMSRPERSRIARAASKVSGMDERKAKSRLVNARIAVRLETESNDDQVTFLAAVRLALLFAGAVTVVLPTGGDEVWDQCKRLAASLRGSIRTIRRANSLEGLKFIAALSFGQTASRDARVVS